MPQHPAGVCSATVEVLVAFDIARRAVAGAFVLAADAAFVPVAAHPVRLVGPGAAVLGTLGLVRVVVAARLAVEVGSIPFHVFSTSTVNFCKNASRITHAGMARGFLQ